MTFTVRVQPDGRRFPVSGTESILEAALRAGLPVDYGCSSGTCGRCRARLVSGDVSPIRNQDFAFSMREKGEGWILLCTQTPDSDVVVEAPVAGDAQEIPVQELTVKLRRLERVGSDLMILHVQTPRSRRLRFLAGQFATLSLAGVGDLNLSIASCPCDDRHLEFHLRRVRDEPVSQALFERLRTGASLEIRAPQGRFVLEENRPGPLILIAFDTGFSAIKSILEHATAQESERVIHLYWLACGPEGRYLDNLCRSWRDALDEFTYTPLDFVSGRDGMDILVDRIAADHPDLDACAVYVCAPSAVLEGIRRSMGEADLYPGTIHYQRVQGNKEAGCLTATTPGSEG